jgi:hypothetical protein
MQRVTGIYRGLGTGAIKIGLGFVPHEVHITRLGQAVATAYETFWNADMLRAALARNGGLARSNATTWVGLADTAGIKPYAGGDTVTAASLAGQLHRDVVTAYRGNLRGSILAWTLDTAANRTGHFDAGLATTYCNVGSTVVIKAASTGKLHEARIAALTNDGDAANEVALDQAVPSGSVIHVGGAWDWVPAPVGVILPAGIEITDVTYANIASNDFALVAIG